MKKQYSDFLEHEEIETLSTVKPKKALRKGKKNFLSFVNNFVYKLLRLRIFSIFNDLLKNELIRNKVFVTIFVLLIYRLLHSIPLPGINMTVYQDVVGSRSPTEATYLFAVFTGGQLESPSIVGLGIVAYINASILMQLLPFAIQKLKDLQKEGERGKKIINQITRLLTIPISFVLSVGYLLLISQQNFGSRSLIDIPVGQSLPNVTKIIFMSLILVAGTMLLMWLSEIITEKGIGNGSSIIIAVGIISAVPAYIFQDIQSLIPSLGNLAENGLQVLINSKLFWLLVVIVTLILFLIFVVFLNESQRNIKIQNVNRLRTSSNASYLPIKVTLTGVLPIIFAFAFLSVPQVLVPLFERIVNNNSPLYNFLQNIKQSFFFAQTDSIVNHLDTIYVLVFVILVVSFGIFYSFIILNPKDTAENLQKSETFIPGIRPGKATQDYLSSVILKVSIIGSIFLAIVSVFPLILRNIILINTGSSVAILSGIGGTSILIVVSVIGEIARQYKSLKATKNYDVYV